MIRMQIQFSEDQAAELRRHAQNRRVSIAAVVRDAVARHLAAEPDDAWERALAVIGRYHGGGGNVAVEHDAYLDDAYLPRAP